jgi:hypothetical protein
MDSCAEGQKMGNGSRNYTRATIKRLYGLSGNECSFPGCNKRLVNDKNALDSNICHIEAAEMGGERYNPNMTDAERADYKNLILLCVQHHAETNDVEKYTVDILRMMKQNHESQYLNEKMNSNPSMIKNTINAISRIELDNYPDTPGLNVIDPGEKIAFNCIKRNSSIIREYKVYFTKLNTLYKELEKQGSVKKEKLLRNIRIIYENVRAGFILDSKESLKIIQLNSDEIFEKVYDTLYHTLDDSGFWDEDIVLGIRIVMVDAFIRCKILEEPPT